MGAVTVWWVTCLDCRKDGGITTEQFPAEKDRDTWVAAHRARAAHKRHAVWDRTSGVTEATEKTA